MNFNRINLNHTSPNQGSVKEEKSRAKNKQKDIGGGSQKQVMKLAIPEAIHDVGQ